MVVHSSLGHSTYEALPMCKTTARASLPSAGVSLGHRWIPERRLSKVNFDIKQHAPDVPAMRTNSIFRNISTHRRNASLQISTASCLRQNTDRGTVMAFKYSRDASPIFENKVKSVALVGVSKSPIMMKLGADLRLGHWTTGKSLCGAYPQHWKAQSHRHHSCRKPHQSPCRRQSGGDRLQRRRLARYGLDGSRLLGHHTVVGSSSRRP